MPAQETWELIGWSFIPLALGLGLLFLGLRVARRRVLRAPILLAAMLPLACWLLMVFVAAYPTIHQTDEGPRGCYGPDGAAVECPPEFQQRQGGE